MTTEQRFTVNGKFTITNSKGEHRTFSVKTQAKDAKFAPGQRVLAVTIPLQQVEIEV